MSYFFIDFLNFLLNDFYFKVESYHTAQNRKTEYFHHIFCFFVAVCCELYYKKLCTFDHSPFIEIVIYSELSTPFLMAWRYSNSDLLFLLFFVVFMICRIYFLGVHVLPSCIQQCVPAVGWGFSIPYYALNFFFAFGMIQKVVRKFFPSKSTEASSRKEKII